MVSRSSRIFALAAMLLLTFTSCSPKLLPFTQSMYDRYTWNENDIKKIQFYLSKEVVLRNASAQGQSTIVDGKIEDQRRKDIDQVVIPAKTPGVLVYLPKANRFGISFESKGGEYLMFGPNPKSGGKYVLLAKSWKNRQGKITYGEKTYTADLGASFAHLLVNIKKVNKVGIKQSVAGGRKVN